MKTNEINFDTFVPRFDAILDRGLCKGLGARNGQMCIEAAVCAALGLAHSDDPKCVSEAVRAFKIGLNDAEWSSPKARAEGLRKLGIAQIGSLGVVKDSDFTQRVAKEIVRVLVPALFRETFPDNPELLAAADRCEQEGTAYAARAASDAARAVARAADVASAAARAADAARAVARAADVASAAARAADADYVAARPASAAYAAARVARAAARVARAAAQPESPDKYLQMSANLAFDVLAELGSPGVGWSH